MGQSWSTESSEDGQLGNATISQLQRSEVDRLFVKACVSTLLPIELVSLKQQMALDELHGNEIITGDQLFALLASPPNLPVKGVLFRCIQFLGKFPFLGAWEDSADITTGEMIKAIVLFSPERRNKLFNDGFDFLKLLFLAVAATGPSFTEKAEKAEKKDQTQAKSAVKVVSKANTVLWSKMPIVQTSDGFDFEKLAVSAQDLVSLLTFVLVISEITIPGKSHFRLSEFDTAFSNWGLYEKRAMILLRSFLPSATRSKTQGSVNFALFERIVTGTMPEVFSPLSSFMDSLLFVNPPGPESGMIQQENTKVITPYTLSQLATFLPAELVYGRMKKLYVASEAGFSMRSFQSKVFKWNAPTILFVSGFRVRETKNKRYEQFKEHFPNFRKTNPDADTTYPNDNDDGEKLTFGAYIAQPWKISNKDCFGDSGSMLFQISPHQSIFKARKIDQHYAYFNTNGGGIGFGNDQPLLKSNTKRYQPGNVSLTIDSSLEFAVFRHLGRGGTYQEGSIYGEEQAPEYEDRFSVTDLEVWGCGTEKDLAEQAKQWEWEQKEALARQRVNVKNLGEERAFLEMAGLVGGHGASGGSM